MLLGLLGLSIGSYAYLDATAPRVLAWPMLLVGLALAAAGFIGAGHGVARTRYRPPAWATAEVVTIGSGLAAAVLMTVAARDLMVVLPDPATLPPLSAVALLAALVGAVPAFATPPPVSYADPTLGVHEGGAGDHVEEGDDRARVA
jgi:energy-coupling factor transport system permease protein